MAAELQASYVTGKTVYFLVRSSVGTIWSTAGGALEAYQTANYADYDIAATEQGTASAYYTADFPAALVNGRYNYVAKERIGGSPAETDPTVATGEIVWAGPAVGLVPLVNASGAVLVGSGLFATVPIATISGVNAVVPIATISGVNAVVPPATLSGVNVIAGSGAFATVPIASISGVNAVVPPANLSGVSVIAGSGAFSVVPPATLSGVSVIAGSGAFTVASLLSGQSVNVYSGQLSGQLVDARLRAGVTHGGANTLLRLDASGTTAPLRITNGGGNAVSFEASGNGSAAHALSLLSENVGLNIEARDRAVYIHSINDAALYLESDAYYAAVFVPGGNSDGIYIARAGTGVGLRVEEFVVAGRLLATSGIVANISGNLWGDVYRVVSGTSLNSGQFVNVYSGQLSGAQVNLLSGNQTAVVSGTNVTPWSGAVFLASGSLQSLSGHAVSLLSGQIVNLYSGERVSLANAFLDLPQSLESGTGTSGLTVRQAFRGIAAATFGVSSGFFSGQATATAQYRNAVNNDITRITAACDQFGNRSGVTTDLT